MGAKPATRRVKTVRLWGDTDKARLWVALQANDGVISHASRDVDIPKATCSLWVAEWRRTNGGEPPPEVMRYVQAIGEDFVARMELARSAAMDRLIEIVPNISNAQQAAVIIGILTDKINMAKNAKPPEAVPAPASLEQVQGQVGEWLIEAVQKAAQRRADTVESTATEQAPLALVAAGQQEMTDE